MAGIEAMAEAVHEAYLTTCARLGWPVKPENQVPYAELAEDAKELDRASVRAVLACLEPENRLLRSLLRDTGRELQDALAEAAATEKDRQQPFGELYLDAAGEPHFICHTTGEDFAASRAALQKFVALLQSKLDAERACPFFEDTRTDAELLAEVAW